LKRPEDGTEEASGNGGSSSARVPESEHEHLTTLARELAKIEDSEKALTVFRATTDLLERGSVDVIEAKAQLIQAEKEREEQKRKAEEERWMLQVRLKEREHEQQLERARLDAEMMLARSRFEEESRNRRIAVLGGMTLSVLGLGGIVGLAIASVLTAPIAVGMIALSAAGLAVAGAAGTGQSVNAEALLKGVRDIMAAGNPAQKKPPED